MRICWSVLVGILAVVGLSAQAAAAEPTGPALTPEQVKFFEEKIRPVLVNQCAECHARDAKKVRGGLLVDSPAALRVGGDSGPAIVPGDVDESLLISALRYDSFEMPPRGKLPAHVIQDFVTWVEQGAFDPRPDEPVARPTRTIDLNEGRKFWAFRPLQPATPPAEISAEVRKLDDIDRLLLARQSEAGLSPVAEADRLTLLRRVTFDLIGLPPTPEEIEDFLEDDSSEAYGRVVERLLTSPRFGERWGRHWLDVARYADSTGGGRSALYDTAWYYRDYVIRAYNEDKPFDQFIVEQLAGDLMPAGTYQEQLDHLQATAFLTLGPTNYELQDKKQLRMDVVDEQIDTMGRAFLAMTIGCARCHDHKFDPIPVTDYYALAGVFRNTQTLIDGNVSTWVKRPLPLPPEAAAKLKQHEQAMQQTQQELAEVDAKIQSLTSAAGDGIVLDDNDATFTGVWTDSTYQKGFVGTRYRHTTQADATAVFETALKPGRYEVRVSQSASSNRCTATPVVIEHASGQETQNINQRIPGPLAGYVSLGTFEFADVGRVTISGGRNGSGVTIADAVQFVPLSIQNEDDEAQVARKAELARMQQLRERLQKTQAQLKSEAPAAPPQLLSVEDVREIEDSPLYVRGDVHKPGDIVPRGFLSVAVRGEHPELPASQSGRLELAQWIASADNPLTARVYVNRVWSHLFGRGLVRTVDNFGLPGERPSHPELLDQLALDFMAGGWSSKQLIRRIVLTQAYRRAADGPTLATDPENRLLSRQNRRRLEAESLYDALLSLSGEIQEQLGGDPVRPETKSEYEYTFDVGRRAVYLPMFRNQLHDLFAVFDFPNPNLSTGQRNVSTLSTQALFLLNSPFVQQRMERTAARLLKEHTGPDERLRQLYLLALSRPPSPTEAAHMRSYLDAEVSHGATELAAWSRAAQALVGSLDFRFH